MGVKRGGKTSQSSDTSSTTKYFVVAQGTESRPTHTRYEYPTPPPPLRKAVSIRTAMSGS